jgi:hypothetical protein
MSCVIADRDETLRKTESFRARTSRSRPKSREVDEKREGKSKSAAKLSWKSLFSMQNAAKGECWMSARVVVGHARPLWPTAKENLTGRLPLSPPPQKSSSSKRVVGS